MGFPLSFHYSISVFSFQMGNNPGAHRSPQTFIVVRHLSRILSTAVMMPIPSSVRFTCFKTNHRFISSVSITPAPTLSPQTLTVVRNRSRSQSIVRMSPIPSIGNPTALRTITIVTSPASGIPAAPIAANVAVRKMTICSSGPNDIP